MEATVMCSNVARGEAAGSMAVLVDVTAEGESTSVTLQRDFTVECRNCMSCASGTDPLVKYEWVEGGADGDEEDEGEDEEEDDDDDEDGVDEGGSGGSFRIEGGADANITHSNTTSDAEGEPIEATFETGYCAVDVVVKTGPNFETYTNQPKTMTVTDIDDKAISNVRFFCEAPDEVGMGGGDDDDGGDDDSSEEDGDDNGGDNKGGGNDDDGDDDDGPGRGRGSGGTGGGSGSRGFDDDD